ncbi:MAG: 3-deoxy-D-manno-octulosonic acid transferase, partial [Proteobacteria bacterium]|nr:3-deoxy-D-manno-octulosonic acid transferase [Pseudomonadota bacterium]
MLVLYNILLLIGIAAGFPLILPAVLLSDKRRKTVLQRLGLAQGMRRSRETTSRCPSKKPIWVHALSVGEVLAAMPLVEKLKVGFQDRDIVVSVSTKTGFEIACKRFKKIADAVFFYPYDLTFSIQRIAGRIDPALVIIVESDIWPNFLSEMEKRKIPVVLVNARMSKRSFAGYRRFDFFFKPLFLTFAGICAQSPEDAGCFKALGVPSGRITVTGNIKFEQDCPALSASNVSRLRQDMQVQPAHRVVLAGSTHKGEESILLDAFSRLKKESDGLLLIVAPRDPERAGSVQRMFRSAGFAAFRMKELNRSTQDGKVDVIIVDAIGILKRLYAIADVAIVGGS